MKRWIAILTAACLALCVGASAFAQDEAPEAMETSKLPAPEEVAELEDVDAVEAEDAEPASGTDATLAAEAATSEVEDAEDAEADEEAQPTDIPEAEPTSTPEPENYEVWFEEGFALTLPEGWVSYAVSEEDKANGIRYALGDGSGERLLYIQLKPTRIADAEALNEAVENTDGLTRTGELTFGDTDFAAFIDSRQNASCCATLWGHDLLVFMFTPQTDSDFMLTASQLMESFNIL